MRCGIAALLIGGLSLVGCRASVSGGVVDNAAYQGAWKSGIEAFHRDLQPYQATATSPGVCNKGGTKNGCYAADQQLIRDLVALDQGLRAAKVPRQYRRADALVHKTIAENVQGLRLRGQSFTSNRDSDFQQANALIQRAGKDWQQAYGAFPDWAKPTPAP